MEHCKYFYELAKNTAKNLEPYCFIRIGLLINYCLFKAYVLKNPEAALSHCKFELKGVDTSKIIAPQYETLKQNISNWTNMTKTKNKSSSS